MHPECHRCPGSLIRRICTTAGCVCLLGGCVANSSNPRMEIRSATMNDVRAAFDVEVLNPGGRNLTITRLDYEVSHGEASFPVASGSWTGALALPAHGNARLSLLAPFDSAPMEPDSMLLHLNGEMYFTDHTGYLGLGSMDLTHTAFRTQVGATRSEP